MTEQRPDPPNVRENRPAIVGDVVFGSAESPVAVCTLASRSLLPELAGRPEIAVAGRVFTENVGVERMVQNLAGFETVRFLIVCGRETRHRVGETILALHRDGLDAGGRVIGSDAPDPTLPNLTADLLRTFQERVAVVDMIGIVDATAIVERAAALAALPVAPPRHRAVTAAPAVHPNDVERIVASRDPASSWEYDPAGYFLVFADHARRRLLVEHHTQGHLLVRVFEGRRAEELCHTIVRRGEVTLLAHAAYLGRELAKAETALELDLEYDQDRPLSRNAVPGGAVTGDEMEETCGDGSGDRRAP
jgi:tetrahydromethanopterin S-methyltransferase subunit A